MSRQSTGPNVREWEAKKPLITQLYLSEGKTLQDVKWWLEEYHGFRARYAMPS
jgi:hypothetical protein